VEQVSVLPLVISFTGTPTVDLPYRLGPVVPKSEFEKLQRRRGEAVAHCVNVGVFLREQLCREGVRGNISKSDYVVGVVFLLESEQKYLNNKEGRAGVCFLQANSGGVFSQNKLFLVERWLDQIIYFVDDWRIFFVPDTRLKLWTIIEHYLFELLLELF
jgi:hypothetical protein